MLFLAFVTNEHQSQDFVVWNELGDECQRFLLPLVHRQMAFYKRNFFPYHMTSYSFDQDLIFVFTPTFNFHVITRIKSQSFLAFFTAFMPVNETSVHILGNIQENLVWMLSGTIFPGHVHDNDANSLRLPDTQTRLVDLRFDLIIQ